MPTIKTSIDQLGDSFQLLLTESDCFHTLFEQSYQLCTHERKQHYIAVIITKPPETIVIFLPTKINTTDLTLPNTLPYYLFDSHSRPTLGIDGSYMAKTKTLKSLIQRLKTLFPPLESDVGEEDNYMTWMYNSIEGVVYASHSYTPTAAPTASDTTTTPADATPPTDTTPSTAADAAAVGVPADMAAPSPPAPAEEEDSSNSSSQDEGYVMV